MTQQFRFRLLLTIFPFLLLPSSKAQQTTQKFVQETVYLLSLPQGYDKDTAARWPLLIFLHGSGEAGFDIDKVKVHGPPKLVGQGKQFPMIIVSPQSDVSWGWNVETLYRLLQDVKKRYRVNADKVYLTGLSMGGFGTFSFAMKYPDEFAAIAPVCGGGDVSQAWKLRHTAMWVFHGAKDDVVPPAGSQHLVDAAKKYNDDVRFTLYPDANHNSWDATYSNDSLYSWFLSKSRFEYKEKPANEEWLKSFTGTYAAAGSDTVRFAVEGGTLYALPPNEKVPLKYAGGTTFFVEAKKAIEISFIESTKAVTGFLFMGNDKITYNKVGK